MERYELLIDDDFKKELFSRLRNARKSIEMQFMTFEGDKTGWSVANILMKKAREGVAVRVIIDYFTDFMVSDIRTNQPKVQKEVKETGRMMESMERAGIQLRRSNPLGPFNIKILMRNHKKIIVIDDVAYLGGFNISDHNFSWHDFMVRIEGPHASHILEDFNNTWNGGRKHLNGSLLTKKTLFENFKRLMNTARHEIIISAPYFMDMFTTRFIIKAAKRGVKVKILTLKKNNIRIRELVSKYLLNILVSHKNIDVHQYKKFSHAKYLIVDRSKIIFGSSNFGIESFYIKDEICMYSANRKLVKDFIEKLYNADLKNSVKLEEFRAKEHTISFFQNILVVVGITLHVSVREALNKLKKLFT